VENRIFAEKFSILTLALLLAFASTSAVAEVDHALPEYTGIPAPEMPPWTGLVGDNPGGGGVIDDFNRPDGPLGPNWTVQVGDIVIADQAATGSNASIATHNSATGDHVEMDVEIDPQGGLQFAAAILNYGGGATNLLIKVQNNDFGPTFDRVFCYTGNQVALFGVGVHVLSERFSSARMLVTVDASRVVTINLTNIDGGTLPDQQYICADAPPPEGPAIGIGTYGNYAIRIDNWGDGPVPVELMSLSVE
jgi:hypothetical protein